MRLSAIILGLLLSGCYSQRVVAVQDLPRALTSGSDVGIIDQHGTEHVVDGPVRAHIDRRADVLTLSRGGLEVQRYPLEDVRSVRTIRFHSAVAAAGVVVGVSLAAVLIGGVVCGFIRQLYGGPLVSPSSDPPSDPGMCLFC